VVTDHKTPTQQGHQNLSKWRRVVTDVGISSGKNNKICYFMTKRGASAPRPPGSDAPALMIDQT